MKKIFRMQYEPCSGTCYAWDPPSGGDDDDSSDDTSSDGDILPLRALRNNVPRLKSVMTNLVAMHQELCGNKNLRYGIDFDEDTGIYIGSFWHYGKLELFSAKDHIDAIEKMSGFVLNFYQTDVYKEESKVDKGLGHNVCEHGEDDNLRRFIIKSSRIPTPNGVDEYLREIGFEVAS